MGERVGGSRGISVTSSSSPSCGLKDARRQTGLQQVGCKSGCLSSGLFFRKTCTDDCLKSAVVSWHWRWGLFCGWPQFGGRASMINVLAISSPWATVGARAEKYSRVDTEKEWGTKAGRREGVALLVEVSRSFFQIKTQQAEPDRLSGELDTQTITESPSVWPWWALNF